MKVKKERLDIILTRRGLTESRQKAQSLIMAGQVEINGRIYDKPGHKFPIDVYINIRRRKREYVSRAGEKLDFALKHFKINVKGLTVLDIGASTGGFTEVLLRRGASKVIAVDVGRGQLHWKLRGDHRVLLMEGVNARYLTLRQVGMPVDMAVVDVSFISLKLVVLPLRKILKPLCPLVTLIKPQFEAGKKQVPKGGVIKDNGLVKTIVERVIKEIEEIGFRYISSLPSPIKGSKGNQEYLAHFIHKDSSDHL